MMQRIAIILIGLGGSGKGTQAEAVVSKYENFLHIDTGRLIEQMVHNPANSDDPVIQTEKENFDSGKWCTPEWVRQVLVDTVLSALESGRSVILSGSPRTIKEAEALIPVLADGYTRDNILVFRINISEETSVFRNSHRKVCESCGRPVMWSKETENLVYCPVCGGKLKTRTLDKPEVIRMRTEQFNSRTRPVIDYLKALGIPIIDIQGEAPPDEVSKQIFGALDPILT